MKKKMVYQTEEQKEIVKFLMVLGIVLVLIALVYFIGNVLIKKEVAPYEYKTGTIANNIAIVGTMLNRPEENYYVLAYDTKGVDASSYVTYANYYTSQMKSNDKTPVQIYYLDLNSGMNKKYYVSENSNPKATKIEELKIKDGTLIKVSKGKIVKYLEGTEAIANELKVS